MSGIAGLVDAQAPRVDVVLRAMLDAIVHRGPDGEGVYVDGGVALGMDRAGCRVVGRRTAREKTTVRGAGGRLLEHSQ